MTRAHRRVEQALKEAKLNWTHIEDGNREQDRPWVIELSNGDELRGEHARQLVTQVIPDYAAEDPYF